jgi:hypothetical protein
MTTDFDQLVDLTDVGPEDRRRLRRVHEMLVAAGPPAELPTALSSPPAEVQRNEVGRPANVVAFPRRRRAAAALLIAASISGACFGGGYLLANQTHRGALHVVQTVPMQGATAGAEQNSFASLRVGSADSNGNWPVQLTVTGLKPLTSPEAHYILMLSKGSKPTWVCGMFKVAASGSTTVTFNVPYRITRDTTWVVTEMAPGIRFPGHVVMTTS